MLAKRAKTKFLDKLSSNQISVLLKSKIQIHLTKMSLQMISVNEESRHKAILSKTAFERDFS